MTDLQFALTAGQRDYLVEVLERELKNTRVEEHRTRTPSYREHIQQHEADIVDLLTKLGKPPTV
jgi:hypothetical protein